MPKRTHPLHGCQHEIFFEHKTNQVYVATTVILSSPSVRWKRVEYGTNYKEYIEYEYAVVDEHEKLMAREVILHLELLWQYVS